MTARLKRAKCSESSWRELLHAMNKSPDEVVVSTEGLNAVLECHEHYAGAEARSAPGMVLKLGRKKCTVDRKILFAFVNEHGDVCGKGP